MAKAAMPGEMLAKSARKVVVATARAPMPVFAASSAVHQSKSGKQRTVKPPEQVAVDDLEGVLRRQHLVDTLVELPQETTPAETSVSVCLSRTK